MQNDDDGSNGYGVRSKVKRPAPGKTSPPDGLRGRTAAVAAAVGSPGPRSTGSHGKPRASRDRAAVQSVRRASANDKDDDGPDERSEIELISGHFVQTLRAVLTKECQAHINGCADLRAAPVPDKRPAADASVSSRNRIQSATRVSVSNFPKLNMQRCSELTF